MARGVDSFGGDAQARGRERRAPLGVRQAVPVGRIAALPQHFEEGGSFGIEVAHRRLIV
ncbi:MAG: hypothetical protein O7I42_03680 [Alphaproteobacteria bacterium]|nr:hypothetical protein [Alphaproteobacteria bacterium]